MRSVRNVKKASLWPASSCESALSSHDLTIGALHGKAGAKSTAGLKGEGHTPSVIWGGPIFVWMPSMRAELNKMADEKPNINGGEREEKKINSEMFFRETSTRRSQVWGRASPREEGEEEAEGHSISSSSPPPGAGRLPTANPKSLTHASYIQQC